MAVTPTESDGGNCCSKPDLTPTGAGQMVRSVGPRGRFFHQGTHGRPATLGAPPNQTNTHKSDGRYLFNTFLDLAEGSRLCLASAGCPEPQCPRSYWTNSSRVGTICTSLLIPPVAAPSDPAWISTSIKVNCDSEAVPVPRAQSGLGLAVLRGGTCNTIILRLLSYPSGRGLCFAT